MPPIIQFPDSTHPALAGILAAAQKQPTPMAGNITKRAKRLLIELAESSNDPAVKLEALSKLADMLARETPRKPQERKNNEAARVLGV